MLDNAKLAYAKTTKALTKPIHFWLSPAGILFVVGIIWLVTLFAEPIILADRPTDIADIAGTRLWLLDKAIYILTIFAAAYWAQHLLHQNTIKRESILSKIDGSIEIAKELQVFVKRVNFIRDMKMSESITRECYTIRNDITQLLITASVYQVPAHQGTVDKIQNLLELLPIKFNNYHKAAVSSLKESEEILPINLSIGEISKAYQLDPEDNEAFRQVHETYDKLVNLVVQLAFHYGKLPEKLMP